MVSLTKQINRYLKNKEISLIILPKCSKLVSKNLDTSKINARKIKNLCMFSPIILITIRSIHSMTNAI